MLYYLLRFIMQPLFWILWRPVVVGRENLRVKGKAIYVSNHVALRDPVVLALVSPRFIHFMGKAELFDSPLKSAFLRAFLVFPIKRKTADLNSLKTALKLLDKGKVFGIFPEGHRAVGETKPFEKGAAFVAASANAPIIPIFIVRETYGFFKRPHIYVGKAISVDDEDIPKRKSEATKVLTEKMESAVKDLKMRWESDKCR